MSFKKANERSTKRSVRIVNPKFANAESLRAACSGYFKRLEEGATEKRPQANIASLTRLCRFLGVARATWQRYGKKEGFAEVITGVEATIRAQRVSAAGQRRAMNLPDMASPPEVSVADGGSSPDHMPSTPALSARPGGHGFESGNQFWRRRSSHGCAPKFADPENLWTACLEYFDWVATNPLKQDRIFNVKGKLEHASLERMRAMSVHALCIFLDISKASWRRCRSREGFTEVTDRVEAIIRTQKFEGAAAFLLNSNIINADLKLGERELAALDEEGRAKVQANADEVKRKLFPEISTGGKEGAI